MKTLALIPARSGSKGLPGKNIRRFCGKPLISWAIEIGLETCDETVLSTDDEEIAAIGAIQGAKVHYRPKELSQDDSPMLGVVQDALKAFRSDVIVLLQPTSPLRTVEHVLEALRLLETKRADSVVSVIPVPPHMSPGYVGTLFSDGRISFPSTTRRQDAIEAYYRDGTVYVTRSEFIREGSLYGHKCIPMVLTPEESATIDTKEDWIRAEKLMKVRV